jgi:hypothetical protein
VIRREQYPPRLPLDDPTFPSGAGNPGRTPLLFAQQLINYFQYFDWQWSRSVGLGSAVGLTGRLPITLAFGLCGIAGWNELWRRDRGAVALLGTLWLVTGLGLVAYMNFKPGFSLFWDTYPSGEQHEVRERDYFFIASFMLWGAVAGLGIAALARRLGAPARRAPLALALVALVPLALNWRAASRRHGPDAQLARDFAYDLLQSVGPYGILFTYGDNDTFPLWYLQEVEGVRQDVAIVNLSLANTAWYLDQWRRRPARPFDRQAAPPLWRDAPAASPPAGPVLPMPDSVFGRLGAFAQERDAELQIRGVSVRLRAGQTVLPRDIAILYLLDAHLGRRPIAIAAPAGSGEWLGLERSIVQRGLAHEIVAHPESLPGVMQGVNGAYLDTAATRRFAEEVYRYAGLFEADTLVLEPAARQLAAALARPWLELAQAAILRRDQPATVAYLRRTIHLMPNAQLLALLARIEREGLEALLRQPPEPSPQP